MIQDYPGRIAVNMEKVVTERSEVNAVTPSLDRRLMFSPSEIPAEIEFNRL
jgi:hypothetical protein